MSILDINDRRNYKPLRTTWEVEGKRGCCWVSLGVYTCVGDLTAARHLRQGYTLVRVRKAAEHGIDAGAWRRIRFVKGTP